MASDFKKLSDSVKPREQLRDADSPRELKPEALLAILLRTGSKSAQNDGHYTQLADIENGKPLRTTYASGRWRENAYNDRSEVTSVTISGVANGYDYDEINNSTSHSPNTPNQYSEFDA